MRGLCFVCRTSRLLLQAWGSLSQEVTLKAKPSHQRRGQPIPAYTYCGSTAVFQQSAVGFFHLKSVEVPLLQVIMFCKAVTDFAVSMGLDMLEVETLN